MKVIVAVFLTIFMITFTSLSFIMINPAFRITLDRLNSTVYSATGPGGTNPQLHWTRVQNTYIAMWGVLCAVLILGWIAYSWFFAQRKEYVTGVQ